MEDVRPYDTNEEQRDESDYAMEWDVAPFEPDDAELPFHLPRD
jgi:hypothetical protein